MSKLQKAEDILRSIAIDIDEYFNQDDPLEKILNGKKPKKKTKKAVKSSSKVLECKYCNSTGFEWGETANGWRLFDEKTGKEHACKGA